MGRCHMTVIAKKQFKSFANTNSILEISFELLRFSLFYAYTDIHYVTKLKTNHSDCPYISQHSLSNLNK